MKYSLLKKMHFTGLIALSLLFHIKVYSQPIDTSGINYYYEQGVPITNKVWVAMDFTNAVDAIKKIATINLNRLPRKNSGQAQGIFSKIVDINGYQLFDSNYFSKEMQFQSCDETLKAIKSLLRLYYTSNGNAGAIKYSNEIAACTVSMLFLLEKQMQITFVLVGDTAKLSEGQKDGLKKVENGLNTVISGMLITIGKDYPFYEKVDIQLMAEYLFPYYNRMKKILPLSSIIEFNRRIVVIAKNHEYKEVRELASKLIGL